LRAVLVGNAMKNLLFEPVEYKIEQTALGVWRSHLSEQGRYFTEFRSHAELLGLPLIHHTRGINPETGRRKVAKGWLAVGRLAYGGIAIGQASCGLIGIGQASFGLLFAFAQAAVGYYALGQLAIAGGFALGQLGLGQVVIAQFGVGEWVLAQAGFGFHLWTTEQQDPAAVEFFRSLLSRFFLAFAPAPLGPE